MHAARRLEGAGKTSSLVRVIDKLTAKKAAKTEEKSPTKKTERKNSGKNKRAFRLFDCPRGKVGDVDIFLSENEKGSVKKPGSRIGRGKHTLTPSPRVRALCAKDIDDLVGKGFPRRELRAAIVDTCIRYGYTRQEAVGIANRHTRSDAPLGRPVHKPIREEHDTKDHGVQYTSAQIDQLLGNWKPRTAEVRARHSQQAFRKMVLTAYGSMCAVTGSREVKVLDAAHIRPYDGPLSDRICNGICLRADIHKLFDAGLISFTADFRVHVSNRVVDDRYRAYHGQQLRLPLKRSDWPDLRSGKV